MILLLVFTWLGVNAATPTTLETVSTASSCMIIYITCVLCDRDTDLFFGLCTMMAQSQNYNCLS